MKYKELPQIDHLDMAVIDNDEVEDMRSTGWSFSSGLSLMTCPTISERNLSLSELNRLEGSYIY